MRTGAGNAATPQRQRTHAPLARCVEKAVQRNQQQWLQVDRLQQNAWTVEWRHAPVQGSHYVGGALGVAAPSGFQTADDKEDAPCKHAETGAACRWPWPWYGPRASRR